MEEANRNSLNSYHGSNIEYFRAWLYMSNRGATAGGDGGVNQGNCAYFGAERLPSSKIGDLKK